MRVDFDDTDVGGFNYEFFRGISTCDAGYAELGECVKTIGRVRDGDFGSWVSEWANLAKQKDMESNGFLEKGASPAALSALLRASNYYRMAVFYADHNDPMHTELWGRGRDCFHKAIKLMSPPLERVEIPFGNAILPGYFLSAGDGRRPTLVAVGGFDSTMEEVYAWIGRVAPRWGWNFLVFEGPGQWSALKLNPGMVFRADYEEPIKAVIDYALTRPDVDPEGLALIGYSLGGYLAPRAVAFDPRIKACIADSLVVDVGEAFRAAWPAVLRNAPSSLFDAIFNGMSRLTPSVRWAYGHAKWAMGINHPHEFFKAWEPYSLRGLEKHITCPLLLLFGEDELEQTSKAMGKMTFDFITALACDREVRLFTKDTGASSHCQIGGMSQAQATVYDWLNITLCKNRAPEKTYKMKINPNLIQAVKKYYGETMADKLSTYKDIAIEG